MLAQIIDVLFGCTHERYTFPMTAKSGARRSDAATLTGTYVVCLDCGKEFAYDWREMKVLSTPAQPRGKLAEAESYLEKVA
ncbi:MAG: hypothetical protein ACE14M_11710 [Terriglobales bacterium]